MKRLLFLMFIVCALSSCTGWDGESKESFTTSCIADAKSTGMDEAAARSMCACRLDKIMKKYPGVEDALEHMDAITNDPDIKACK